jgi:2-oxoglutarate ferredoxin oxidoreductase subunit beta
MTGGQFSPMTPEGANATTAPYGNIDRNFDLCQLTEAAGATFTARGATFNPRQLTDIIKKALLHKGFSFVESFTQCPVRYGKLNQIADPVEMLKLQKETTADIKKWVKLSNEEKEKFYPLGILNEEINPENEYTFRYQKIIEKTLEKGVL